jgi:hypothetical protein
MDITLKSAFIISAIIHAGAFAPFYNQHLLRMEMEKKNSVVVDYVILKEIATAIATNKEIVLKRAETPSIDIQKEIAIRPQPAPKEQVDNRKSSKASKLKNKTNLRKHGAVKSSAKEKVKTEAKLKQDEDYVNYYQLIREKIRSKLKDNYQYYKREGDVYLSFSLTQNGSLLTYTIDRVKSTQDETLLQITASSLKAISPFPTLPKSLSTSQMSFNIVISFKK